MPGLAGLKRLHVVMAASGVASRRRAEAMILNGEVCVNGTVVRSQGLKVDPARDRIEVRGKPIRLLPEPKRYFIFHKPLGVVTSLRDVHAERTIQDFFHDVPARLFPAGRLDKDSTGLLLMTNDGELVHCLTHPRFGVKKRYRVVIDKIFPEETLERLEHGVLIEGRKTAPCKIEKVCEKSDGRMELIVTLHEGRKRQIRLMMREAGARTIKLHRETYGPLTLAGLRAGARRELSAKEVAALRKEAEGGGKAV